MFETIIDTGSIDIETINFCLSFRSLNNSSVGKPFNLKFSSWFENLRLISSASGSIH
ncbi:MAG: hypothetical protein WCI41_01650 [bacterium]